MSTGRLTFNRESYSSDLLYLDITNKAYITRNFVKMYKHKYLPHAITLFPSLVLVIMPLASHHLLANLGTIIFDLLFFLIYFSV